MSSRFSHSNTDLARLARVEPSAISSLIALQTTWTTPTGSQRTETDSVRDVLVSSSGIIAASQLASPSGGPLLEQKV